MMIDVGHPRCTEAPELMGNAVDRVYDVGRRGTHRLFAHHERLRQASALVVVAGMAGALPSVAGELVDRPLVAVPTRRKWPRAFDPLSGRADACGKSRSGGGRRADKPG